MALSDFFRINMPYGIQRKGKTLWACFNREYSPLGFSFVDHNGFVPAHYAEYFSMHEPFLLSIAEGGEEGVSRNDYGDIMRVWFYNDWTNPMNNEDKLYWKAYLDKLQKLSSKRLKRDGGNQFVYDDLVHSFQYNPAQKCFHFGFDNHKPKGWHVIATYVKPYDADRFVELCDKYPDFLEDVNLMKRQWKKING
jgi:hypothetical protein